LIAPPTSAATLEDIVQSVAVKVESPSANTAAPKLAEFEVIEQFANITAGFSTTNTAPPEE